MSAANHEYSIGSAHIPGLSKLIEELGECGQVAGKIVGFGGFGEHWDGSDLKTRLEEEMGDVIGAIGFFIEAWGLGFCLGNTVKYISRAGKKGDKLEDLLRRRAGI